MKKIACLLLLTLSSITSLSLSAKEWKTIRIGVEGAYPPFSQTEADGSVTGFDIDISYALCAELNAKCVLVPQDWDGLIPSLLGRRFDAIIASMSITEERKKKVTFTDKYYVSPAVLVGRKDNKSKTDVNSLANKKIVVQGETVMDNYATDVYKKSKIVRYVKQVVASLDLVAGRADYGFMEVATAKGFLSSKKGQDFEIKSKPVSDPKWFGEGIGIALRKKDSDLKDKLNQAIKSIRKKGIYQKIAAKYFDYDIYGD